MTFYELKRSDVLNIIVARLESESALIETLKWDECELRYIASDICDELGIEDGEKVEPGSGRETG